MMSKKLSAIILSVMLVAGSSAMKSVKAEELSLDTIYANAYNATVAAMQAKTQVSINTARAAISEIPSDLDWAIGEFSKQVDLVQQPIFVKAYDAIVTAQNTPTQANVNVAKAAIDPDMPAYYKGSYSTAVDLVQQQLMQNAVDAFNKALQSGLQADVDAANAIFEDIKTSTNSDIVQWVDLVQGLSNISDLDDGETHTSSYAINSASGTFGPSDAAKPTSITGNILINNADGTSVTLQNLDITGNISVLFGSGNVVLNNVKVNGVIVTDIGSNSLHIDGASTVDKLTVQDSNNDAHILVDGTAAVAKAEFLSGGRLEAVNGAAVTKVGISIADPANKVVLAGDFGDVDVTKEANIEVESGTVSMISSTNAAVNVITGDTAVVNVGEGSDNIKVTAKADIVAKEQAVTRLQNAIAAEVQEEEAYTSESYEAYSHALEAAKAIVTDTAATTEINDAAQALETATANLVLAE